MTSPALPTSCIAPTPFAPLMQLAASMHEALRQVDAAENMKIN